MREFWILFKHEMKMQFPMKPQKKKLDIGGTALAFLTTLLVAAVFIILVSTVVRNYVLVEINCQFLICLMNLEMDVILTS